MATAKLPTQEEEGEDERGKRGKAQRKQPEVLCNCPQKCGERIPEDLKESLFKEFSLLGDHYSQNCYLQSYIEMRSVYKRLWCEEERVGGRLQRRVSCKYRVPLEIPYPLLPPNESRTPPKLSTNSKGKMTLVVGAKCGVKTVEVCQKAFMNVYGITEKRIRLQREKLIARLRRNRTEPTVPAVDHDIAVVDSFFRNQLWKPEYIGIAETDVSV